MHEQQQEITKTVVSASPMEALLADSKLAMPKVDDTIDGKVLEVAKNAVYVDLGPYGIGVVRGRELWESLDSYANLKAGDTVPATVLELENEDGQIELSFKKAGEERAWSDLKKKLESNEIFGIRIREANRGGLIAQINGIPAFLPVSQLSSEHYPRVEGGDQGKILEKLKSFVGTELRVKVITADSTEEKLVISEKEARFEEQKDKIGQLKVGQVIEGVVSGIVDFGVFVKFALPGSETRNMEGLVHISELAWQRIDDPADIVKVGEAVKAEIIGVDGTKISLSIKKLEQDPWVNAVKRYSVGQIIEGAVTKLNPFGAFVQLDKDIHGLAHISELSHKKIREARDVINVGDVRKFKILSIEPAEHRLGLSLRALEKDETAKEPEAKEEAKAEEKTAEAPKEEKAEKPAEQEEEKPSKPSKTPKSKEGPAA